MVRIEATCPSCGTVECSPGDFELRVSSHGPASFYAFVCPKCNERIRKRADQRAIEILVAEGIQPLPLDVPAEIFERPAGPRLTVDDLLDLHMLLERPDWFEQLTSR